MLDLLFRPFHSPHFSPQQCFICFQEVFVLVASHSPNAVPHKFYALCYTSVSCLNTRLCPFCRQLIQLATPVPHKVSSFFQFRVQRPLSSLFLSLIHLALFFRPTSLLRDLYHTKRSLIFSDFVIFIF